MNLYGTIIFVYVTYWSAVVYAVKPLQYLKADPTSKGASILTDGNTACESNCRGSPKQYFCASNGRTLDSLCRAQQARCHDPYLNVTAGKCRSSVRCRKERSHSLLVQRFPNLAQTVNVPSCKKDGSYTPIQCHMFFGYCWCVTSIGKMIKDSTFVIGGDTPSCGRSRDARKRRCTTEADKASFALTLRRLIENENTRRSSTIISSPIKRKHFQMDANSDGRLNTREMRRLLRAYRRNLPRACIKVFWKFCDFNHDRQVSLAEFGLCLGAIRNMRDWEVSATGPTTTIQPRTRSARLSERIVNPVRPRPASKNRTRTTRQGTSPSLTLETCRYMRQELLKGRKKNVDIPDCEGPEGQYWSQVQCHATYCYCVDRDTGVPVPATAVKSSSGVPNCQKVVTSLNVSRPISGCPSRLKDKFLNSVQKALIQEMTKNRIEVEESGPVKERAARWFFSYLDENGDNALGRRESKAFKKFLLNSKVSKRCLRKFTQHCDRDKNAKISLEEFVGCLEVRKPDRLRQYPELRDTIDRLKSTDDADNS